jgi:hypothetical protein
MLWFCQCVALAISAKVAPLGRRRSSRIVAFFDPSRASVAGWDAFLLVRFAPFLVAGLFFGAAFFAPRLAWGAPFFWLAGLVRGALLRRDAGARARIGVGLGIGGGFCVRHRGRYPFRRWIRA